VLHTKKIPLFNAFGQATYLLGVSEDVTDQHTAELERASREHEQRSRIGRVLKRRMVRMCINRSSS
jgi:hypothetical protein